MSAKLLQLCLTLCRPTSYQAPLSMWFSRQEYWHGLPFPSPGDFPHPVIESKFLTSPALADGIFTIVPPGKASRSMSSFKMFPKFFLLLTFTGLIWGFSLSPFFFLLSFFFQSSRFLTASISKFIWIKKDLAFHFSWLKLNSISRAICDNDSPSTRGMAFLDLTADLVSWDRNDSP